MKPHQFIAMLLVVVFVLYPLSIGPAMRLHVSRRGRSAPTSGTFRAFYKPLEVLCRNQTANSAFDWYINLWLPH